MGFCLWQKKIGKNLSSKYSQKRLHSEKKSTTNVIKTASKRSMQKPAQTTGDLIGSKIADKIISASKKFSKYSQNNEANDKSEAQKERYISPEKNSKLLMN